MEINNLEVVWQKQELKLDKVLQVNYELIKKINLKEVHHKLKKPLRYEFLTLGMTVIFVIYLLILSSSYFDLWMYSIPGFTAAFCSIGLILFSFKRIHLIRKSFDFKLPVAELQKQLGTLALKKLKYAKFELLLGIGAAVFMWPAVLNSGFSINVYQNPLILIVILMFISIIAIPVTITYERSYQKNISDVKELLAELDHQD